MTNNTDLVRVHDELRVQATLLRTPEFMAQFDPEKFAGQLERIADALAQQPAPVGDDPIDAKDNAGYIEHCADRLERLGHRVTAGALRVIAIEHRALAQQHAAPSGEAVAWAAMSANGSRVVSISLERDEYVGHVVPLYTAPQQPAAGEEIMVNAAHDVYTLPLQPSGLLSGPRFVVHVPGPQQPAAVVDEAAVWRVIAELRAYNPAADEHKGAHIHKVWAKELAAALAAQQQEVPRG